MNYFAWKQFVDIAQEIIQNVMDKKLPDEAGYRCAISRAYYGAFRHAFFHAKDNKPEFDDFEPYNDGKDHHYLPQYYFEKGDREVARWLRQTLNWRLDADYNEPSINAHKKETALSSIETAQKIIKKLH